MVPIALHHENYLSDSLVNTTWHLLSAPHIQTGIEIASSILFCLTKYP